MRLKNADQSRIISTLDHFVKAPYRLYLFGSRADESKKGGDIDLLVLTDKESVKELNTAKSRIIITLHKTIGERKIDLTFDTDPPEMEFVKTILPSAVEIPVERLRQIDP